MKTNKTKQIEKEIFAIYNDKYGRGQTVVLECQIGNWNKDIRLGIVDAIAYNQTKDEFVCFEIKISVADFHSKAKKTFVGNRNYYAMPIDIYEKVKNEIPKDIGCYVLEPIKNSLGIYRFYCIKKCKPKQLEISKELLLANMLRSARNKTNLEYVGV